MSPAESQAWNLVLDSLQNTVGGFEWLMANLEGEQRLIVMAAGKLVADASGLLAEAVVK